MGKCRQSGRYEPVFFEWYKFVGELNVIVAHIQRDSPALQPLPPQHFHILVGLLNRCARLILANVALSHQGRFGETTAIVDRCIFESEVKVIWLCTEPSQEKFARFLADGLRADLELKTSIQRNVAARSGSVLKIERRMLDSIDRSVRSAGLTESQIVASKKMPDLSAMLRDIRHDRLTYVVGQKIGSHHIHGTWTSLLVHYLEEGDNEFEFTPRSGPSATHINQFVFVPLIVLRALTAYTRYALDEGDAFEKLFQATEDEIFTIYEEVVGDDMAFEAKVTS